jgi:phosphonate transport system permease protein
MTSATDFARLRACFPRAFGQPLLTRVLQYLGTVLFIAWLVALCSWFDITPARLSRGISGLFVILRRMIPPSPGARNVLVNVLAHFSIRRVFDGLCSMDQIIWALAFVRGVGPVAGVMAIAAADICVLAKQFAEAIENADPRQQEAVRAAGASRLLVIRFGLLPQVLPVLLAQVLYAFESNTRSAALLGVVGAGGMDCR